MPTYGNASDLSEQQQALIDSAQVGYEAFLQSLNPTDRFTQEQLDRQQMEESEVQAQEDASSGPEVEATPEARAEAERLDVDLLEVDGTGERGRIKLEDVRSHAGLEEGDNK